ncbi:MAG: WYL domain-containing protein, partial [Prevotella sp.]
EDIVGVTNFKDSPVYEIYFWVSDTSKEYVKTKPIHESQRTLNETTTTAMREKYPLLIGGQFFRIDCKCNYELIRELTSFGKELIVLEPEHIYNKVNERISEMIEEYGKLRT